jgi:predicted ATPase
MDPLKRLSIRGFKSIEELEKLELGSINVLIGANGSGKSNFVSFFHMLRALIDQRFQGFVAKNGPADGYFFNGVGYTKRIEADMEFGLNRYVFVLEPTSEGKIIIAEEATQYVPGAQLKGISYRVAESALASLKDEPGLTWQKGPNWYVYGALTGWQVYHFHDTSMTAGMRRDVGVEQGESLWPDAGNLAAFLLNIRNRHRENYEMIRKTLQRIAPFFDDFDLRVTKAEPENTVRLRWRRRGSDYIFSPGHLSDGTIRFLCLAAVLLQPKPPTTIVLDEPELGLHPEAIAILGGLIRSAAARMQIIAATQSPLLVNEFEPGQIITVDEVEGATQLNRLDEKQLAEWLKDFTVGELWQKGTIRGGVNHA